ncbi:MAG: hypothetical protein IT371_29460 [Deltaproteobacteria bacterium]|nr:hypothetical protein [Deltaproteobacteria bacterium]
MKHVVFASCRGPSLLLLALTLLGCEPPPDRTGRPPDDPSTVTFPLARDPLDADHPYPATRQLDPATGRWRLSRGALAFTTGAPVKTRELFARLETELGELDGVGATAVVRIPYRGSLVKESLAAAVRVLPLGGGPAVAVEARLEGQTLELRPQGSWSSGASYAVLVLAGQPGGALSCTPDETVKELLGTEPLADPSLREERRRLAPLLAASGLAREQLCLAFTFRVQDTAFGLRQLRERLATLARTHAPQVTITEVVPGARVKGLEDVRAVDRVLYGTYRAPELRDARGHFIPARVTGGEEPPYVELRFGLALPRRAQPGSGPFPVVMGIHGFGGSIDTTLPLYARYLAEAGFAYLTIDGVDHGSRSNGTPAEITFLDASDLRRTRDRFRQTLADLYQLRLTVAAGSFVDGERQLLMRTRVRWSGGSYGGIMGTMLAALDPELEAAHVEACGGPWRDVMLHTAASSILDMFVAVQLGMSPGDPRFRGLIRRYLELAQWVLDAGDVSAAAQHVLRQPLDGRPHRRLLMQYWLGDQLMPRQASDLLADALGAPANRTLENAEGVIGIWRYDVTEWGLTPGTEAHGAFWRIPAARAQAVRFLSSFGTSITPPDRN